MVLLAILLVLVALYVSMFIDLDLLLSWIFRNRQKQTKTRPDFWDPDI